MKLENAQERFNHIEIANKQLEIQLQKYTVDLHGALSTLDKTRNEGGMYEEQLKREVEDARVEIEDLSDLLKTKDRMLEDKNIVIEELKDKAKEKEIEVKQLIESKQKYRDFYEEKLQVEYDEADKLRARNDELQQTTQSAEYELDQARQDLGDCQD